MRLVLIDCVGRVATVFESLPKRHAVAVFEFTPDAEVTPADVEAIRIEPHQPPKEQ